MTFRKTFWQETGHNRPVYCGSSVQFQQTLAVLVFHREDYIEGLLWQWRTAWMVECCSSPYPRVHCIHEHPEKKRLRPERVEYRENETSDSRSWLFQTSNRWRPEVILEARAGDYLPESPRLLVNYVSLDFDINGTYLCWPVFLISSQIGVEFSSNQTAEGAPPWDRNSLATSWCRLMSID